MSVRFSFAKIAEYPARGLVHIQAVIRLDRSMPAYRATELRPPDTSFTPELREPAVRDAAQDVCVRAPE